jgi:CTP:molybdopterin cytidylyltransferase MocA
LGLVVRMMGEVEVVDIAILLLAAGASSRMRGADKLLEEIDGMALLRRQALVALASGCSVWVALPLDRPARLAALEGLDLSVVEVAEAREGMAASIRAGVAALPSAMRAVVVLPADMPEITAQDLVAVMGRFDGRSLVQGTGGAGDAGHPVLFPARLFPDLCALQGDQGARAVLRDQPVIRVALPDRHALTDLDTPEDWAAWRAAQTPR